MRRGKTVKMKKRMVQILTWLLVATLLVASPALAVDWDYKGSLGEGKHKRYVPPLSNPFLNETPYITTEARAVFIHNQIPGGVFANTPFAPGTAGGGQINVYTLQLRLALTDRFGVIINKNGVMNFNHSTVDALTDNGIANIALGVKYALISDPLQERLVTVGITYEIPSGTLKADAFRLQGDGSGFINTFLTLANSFNKVGLEGMLGFKVALDSGRNVSWFNYSLHADYEIVPNLFPLVELNGFVPIDDARQFAFDFEGLDLVSVGGSDPSSVTTFAAGARYRITEKVMAGLAYEVPTSHDKDIMKWRVTADLVFYY